MIEPTEGRIVWFYPSEDDVRLWPQYNGKRFAAFVAEVQDNELVNLMVVGHDGYPHPRSNILLIQDDVQKPKDHKKPYCEWMPYQKGQAAKAEAAEKAAAERARS